MDAAASGPLLFARYAYGPNRLGYCGPDAAAELLGEAAHGHDDRALRRLATGFEGAYPYLQLIASASGIADPLDRRVVDAYWLGNPLLETVRARQMGESLDVRFRRRLSVDGWRWLAEKPSTGARPVHAFHVMDVFPRLGLMRSGEAERVLETIDSCRIRWGRVVERDGESLLVNAVPIVMVDGKLHLAAPRLEKIQGWRDGNGFVDDVTPGDVISIHWNWACERLSHSRLAALQQWTVRELEIANQTI